jgi:hypothetical protein
MTKATAALADYARRLIDTHVPSGISPVCRNALAGFLQACEKEVEVSGTLRNAQGDSMEVVSLLSSILQELRRAKPEEVVEVTPRGHRVVREGEGWRCTRCWAHTRGTMKDLDVLECAPQNATIWQAGIRFFRRREDALASVADPSGYIHDYVIPHTLE